jgi:hypothetical protein
MDRREDGVKGLMERLKLSDQEKKGIKIGGSRAVMRGRGESQAVEKVLTEKPVRADALELSLGKVWCPIKGVECKDLGENRFLFTFLQVSGKRRALEDGPWMFGKDLVVVDDFDGGKTIDEVEFNLIPIWVRILKMPLGFMNRVAGEMIREMVGVVLEVDADEKGMAVGEFLRVKVQLDIRKPLMRGVTVDVGEGAEEKTKWCPLVYEYLPDFCYTCGLIGHIDRFCEMKPQKGMIQQFSRALRYILEKKKFGDDVRGKNSEQRSLLPWRRVSNSWGSSGRKGSESDSWHKGEKFGEEKELRSGEEQEVTSPLKESKSSMQAAGSKKALSFEDSVPQTEKENTVLPEEMASAVKEAMGGGCVDVHGKDYSTMQDVAGDKNLKVEKNKGGGSGRGFKRIERPHHNTKELGESVAVEKKRNREEEECMDVDEDDRATKVGKLAVEDGGDPMKKAGPADRSRGNQ